MSSLVGPILTSPFKWNSVLISVLLVIGCNALYGGNYCILVGLSGLGLARVATGMASMTYFLSMLHRKTFLVVGNYTSGGVIH